MTDTKEQNRKSKPEIHNKLISIVMERVKKEKLYEQKGCRTA